MKTKRLLLSLVTMLVTTVSWAAVTINATNFPDYYFRQYLQSQDYGSDSYLSDAEIAKVTSINVSGTSSSPGNITNLKGIEFFTALKYLYCSYNQLTSLDVSKNTALTTLRCYNNKLTSLDVSKNTALTNLDCENNKLTSLNVLNNTKLTMLRCSSNQLTSLNVSKNIELTELDCYYNQLTSLDVSKNTKLTLLYCESNQLTSLDVSKNIELTWLYCYNNQITSLDVSKNTALKYLYCYSNQLTSLDVSKNTALTYLSCSSNQLTSLDVSKNTKLTTLYCYNNQLNSLDVSGCTALTYLFCFGNQLTSLDVSGCTALKYLYCYNNKLTSLDVSKNTKLTMLQCHQNQIKGTAMDALVESMPTVSSGIMYVINNENEGNVMTTTQVAAAKAKGWTPQYYTGSGWQEYAGSEDEPVPVEKCATPTISYANGKLQFSCETEGVEYVYNVTPPSATAGSGTDITLPTTYTVTVYATKSGYDNSDVATKDINVGGAGGIRGDVNGDGTVGMPDAMFIVNKVLKGKFPDEEKTTTYYYYAGWTLPTESNIETIINETLPEDSGSSTLNNCGKKTTSKSFMDFSSNTLYNVNGRDYYYVLVPEGQTLVDPDYVDITENYTSQGTITIGNQTHTIYKSNITTRYINDITIY